MLTTPRSEDYNRELENEVSILRNSNSWLNMQMQELAKILRLPGDKTMKDLVAHAEAVMDQLRKV